MSVIATSHPSAADQALRAASEPAHATAERAAKPRLHHWTYEQFTSLWELGILGKKRVELLDGKIIHRAPQEDPHSVGCILAQQVMSKTFGVGFTVRLSLPLQVDEYSAPEPDVAVVTGSARDSLGKGHPRSALLVVEISDTSLRYDRGFKAAVYARAGIADYWIVDLVDHVVEVRRQPIADPAARLGHRYASIERHGLSASIAPLAAPETLIAVADLLP